MANPHKGEVAFEADGKRYILQFSIDALCNLEAEAGKGIVALISDINDPMTMSLTRLRQMLWAGLLQHQPDTTIEGAGELIPKAGGLLALREKIAEAFAAAFPDASKETKARPRKAGNPKNGIGPHSTAHGVASDMSQSTSGD